MIKGLSDQEIEEILNKELPEGCVRIPREQWKSVFTEVAARQNDLALAPAGEMKNSTESASGGLPAAPCSAPVFSNQVVGVEYTFTQKVEFSDRGYKEEVFLDANQPSICSPCFTPSKERAFAYIYDEQTKEIIGTSEFSASYLNLGDCSYIPNYLIRKFGGIKENQRIKITRQNLEELRSEWAGQPQPKHNN